MKDSCLTMLSIILLILINTALLAPAQEVNGPPVDLSRKLTEFRIERRNWAVALMILLERNRIPYLLEMDTLTYRDMSVRDKLGLFNGSKEQQGEKGRQWFTAFKVDLKDVTIDQVMKEILKDQPRYTYEVVADGRCLRVFPRDIQKREEWPLNRNVEEFSIEQQQLADKGYRKTFGVFLLKYQVHIAEFNWRGPSQCLSARVFHNVTLRKLLTELAATCHVGWAVEPLPEEEIKFREIHDKEYYERGYDIGRPGTNGWCQIHYSFLNEPTR